MTNTRNINGKVVTAGRFRGDDEVASKLIVEKQVSGDVSSAGVHVDPGSLEGPIVVKYNLNSGQKGFTVEEKGTGEDVFSIGQDGTTMVNQDLRTFGDRAIFNIDNEFMVVEPHNGIELIDARVGPPPTLGFNAESTFQGDATFRDDLVCDKTVFGTHLNANQNLDVGQDLDVGRAVSGGAFDKVDDHTSLQPHDTAVTRNSTTGCCNLSNLRVYARKLEGTAYLTNGLCPDNLPPGLFVTEGMLTGPLTLVDNGHVVFAKDLGNDHQRYYRFGIHSGGSDVLADGMHMANEATQEEIKAVLAPNGTKFVVAGNSTSVSEPLVSFQTDTGNEALNVTGKVSVEAESGGTALHSKAGNVHFEAADGTDMLLAVDGGAVSIPVLQSGNALLMDDQLQNLQGLAFTHSGNDPIIVAENNSGDRLFQLDADGSMHFTNTFSFSRGHPNPLFRHSIVTQDNSVFIGSCRLSYDRTNHVMTLYRLKTDHVPLYLQGRNFTAADLPVGEGLNDMSCADWFSWACEHFGEDLHMNDVFPSTNTGDWVQIDAPVPFLQAWANGADADITTLETEMDAAEARLDTAEAGLVAETSARAAADATLTADLTTERNRINAILNLSNEDLDTFIEIETAFKAADSSIEQTVTNLTTNAAAARAVIQADVDANEAAALAGRQAIQADVDANEATALAGRQAIQADVDANEAAALTARQAIQADVDANEAAALAGRQAIQADVDANEAAALVARNAIQADVDSNEAVATADRLDIRADYIAADTVVSNAYIAADSAVTAAQLVITNALDGRLDALEAAGGGASAPVTEAVYVNSSYSGNSDGSSLQPYTTLVAALAAKLSDGSSTKYTFHLAPGTYTGAVSYTFSGNTQSFAIKGAGADCTFVEAASISQNALYFRGFKDIEISDITVQTCLYGIYPRDCKRVVIRNCVMQYCGSDGTAASHDQSGTQAEQAAFWASASTSSGGAARIRECTEVQIQDNTVRYCLRGLRVQDCGSDATASTISNNNCYRTLESSIYLASGSYTGSGGCRSINVVGNTVHEAFNNGILVIGGQHNAIMSNSILRSANAGIQCWSVLDTRVCGNSLFDCNRRQWNGIGNLGDAFGNIVIDGSSGIGTGTYIACLTGNSILKANAGRAGEVRGITLGDIDGYPAESGKVQLDANFTDAAVKLSNEQSITITTEALDTRVAAVETKTAGVTEQQLSYLSGVTGNIQAQLDAGLGSTAAVASSGAAHFSVSSSSALIHGTEQVKMDFVLDRSGTNFDYQYKFHNHRGHLLFTQMQHQRDLGIFSIDEDTACLTIAGGSYINQDCPTSLMRQWTGVPNASLNDLSLHVLGRAAFKNNIRLPLNSTPGSSGDTGTQGDIQIDDDNIWVRNASTWKKAPLVAFDAPAASGPGSVVTSTGHENPGGSGSGWPILPDDISLLVVSHSTAGAVRRRMPLSVPNGFSFKIISTSNQGVLNLYHSGASDGLFYPGSLGFLNNVYCAINTAVYNPISCFFVDSKWFVVADGTVPVA